VSALSRLPDSRFSEVMRAWEGGLCVLLGGGPSLTREQVAQVRIAHHARCIAINNSYRLAPWADVCYFADAAWWKVHKEDQEFIDFAGQKCSIQDSMTKIDDDAVHILKNRDFPHHGSGLSLDSTAIVTGRNSAYQALNLAVLAGAKIIILLGIDGRPGKDGRSHWHNGHARPTPLAAYEEYRRAFSAAENEITAAGVRVINASPGSAIDSFEKMELARALALWFA
jgi:hypothetical protein